LTLRQISEAIRRYGVSDTTSSLFVVRIGGADTSSSGMLDKMNAVVSGTIVPIRDLETVTDWMTIQKVWHGYYRINLIDIV
jgi:EKC/KEOPS complex subunit CGI121/TPRKB